MGSLAGCGAEPRGENFGNFVAEITVFVAEITIIRRLKSCVFSKTISQLDTKAGKDWTKKELSDLTKDFNQQFADLNVGDIGGMQDYIDQIGDLSEFQGDAQQTLSDIQSTAASDKDYLSGLFDNLNTSLYGEGGDLDQYIKKSQKKKRFLNDSLILHWMKQITQGLNYCH